jgi:hypothetical protein
MEALGSRTWGRLRESCLSQQFSRPGVLEIAPRYRRVVWRAEQTGNTTQKLDVSPLPSQSTANFAMPRRSLLSSVLFSSTILSLPSGDKQALAATNYREYIDRLDGYTFTYPSSWIQVKGAGADVFFRNPVNLDENVVVDFSSPSSSRFKSVEDLGTPEEAAQKVLKQKVVEFMSTRLGVRRESKVISANSRVGDDGRLYYDIEVSFSFCIC